MTIRHLKVFIKVTEFNSISKASESLCVAQPSVSQTIKELERYYGIILFDRVGKKLHLTKEGETLLAKAKDVVNEFDDFELLANKEKTNPIVKIGATMSFGDFFLSNFIDALKEEIPCVEPYIYIGKNKVLEEKILSGDLDFAIVEGLSLNNAIESIEVGEDFLVLVAHKDYPIPNKIKIKDLTKYNLLLREVDSPCRRLLDCHLSNNGIKITLPVVESISNNVIKIMVESKKGVGILPYALVKEQLENGKLRKIDLDIPLDRKLYIIATKNKKFNKIAEKAFKMCSSILKKTTN